MEVVATIVSEGLPAEVVPRVAGVCRYEGSSCGAGRTPGAVRNALLAEAIGEVHIASRRTFGAQRVYAELVLGRGPQDARGTVESLMRRRRLRLGLLGTHRHVAANHC